MDNTHPTTARFVGEFSFGMDAKKRITIPAPWRLTEADAFYFMADRSGRCLEALPPEEFHRVGQQIAALEHLTQRERRDAKRDWYSGATELVADKQGRMVLPEPLCVKAGLTDALVFVGVDSTFEIWSPTAREDKRPSDNSALDRALEMIGR